MNKNKGILSLVVSIIITFITGCAPQQALLKSTSSGYPEGIFLNSTVDVVRSKLLDGCSSKGILVQETNENQIVCAKTMEGGEAMLATMLVGNSYSTPPQRKFRFIIYQFGSDVKVTAQQWIESQMAFGQLRKEELNDNKQKNDIQQFLFSLGAK